MRGGLVARQQQAKSVGEQAALAKLAADGLQQDGGGGLGGAGECLLVEAEGGGLVLLRESLLIKSLLLEGMVAKPHLRQPGVGDGGGRRQGLDVVGFALGGGGFRAALAGHGGKPAHAVFQVRVELDGAPQALLAQALLACVHLGFGQVDQNDGGLAGLRDVLLQQLQGLRRAVIFPQDNAEDDGAALTVWVNCTELAGGGDDGL